MRATTYNRAIGPSNVGKIIMIEVSCTGRLVAGGNEADICELRFRAQGDGDGGTTLLERPDPGGVRIDAGLRNQRDETAIMRRVQEYCLLGTGRPAPDRPVKIATYNVNGINGRLPVLLRWLEQDRPDIVCLQELKASDEHFPLSAIRALGYDAIWHGQKSWNGVAILSRVGEIHETRRGLPGDPDDRHSRYIEAAVNGILVAGLYLPNGNPRPGPKFDYKLRWFDRLIAHASDLLATGVPVMIIGDFNVMPTERDVRKPERWIDDALFAPEVRAAYFRLLDQGWTDALRMRHPDETIYTFWKYWRASFERNDGLRIDHLLLSPSLADRLIDAQVDDHVRSWEKTSDHAPVWVELADNLKKRKRPRKAGRDALASQ